MIKERSIFARCEIQLVIDDMRADAANTVLGASQDTQGEEF